ncbi:hypothetical protein TrLO_g7578 [Triparma laevis f. longispina]|uniref:Disease resistance R13L4/SHOC-2-like LRR domain-containing protein n=1 Tax=Triparma laevis f. longispina TaxID=1714387 RepID=A0A9W7CKA6_9STRA|nr:hypothetical protein TrLO_g7578 [Triparma laevis f. longispina]
MSDDKKKSEQGGAAEGLLKRFSLNRMGSGGDSERKLPIQSLTPQSGSSLVEEVSSPLSLLGTPTASDNSGREAPDEPNTSESPSLTTAPSPKPSAEPTTTEPTTPTSTLTSNPGDAAPGVTPGDTPGDTPGVTPGVTPGDTPGVTPGDTPGVTPGDTPGVTPGDTPGDTPRVVLEASKDLSEDGEILLKAWVDMGGKEPDLKKSKGKDVSEWEGIVVDQDRVVKITWSEKSFIEQISPEIGRLNKLKTLDLASNQLRGPIPDVLGNLKELEILHLDGNLLSKSIPPTLGGCKKLEELHLDRNKLQGDIPKQIGDCSNLKMLRASGNKLSGSIPEELGRCSDLEELYLNGNDLQGVIPKSLGECKELCTINLQKNENFSEETPDEVAFLPKLEKIHFNSGVKAQGRLGKDGEAVLKIWESLGGAPKVLMTDKDGKDVGFDVSEWHSVGVNGRVIRLNKKLTGKLDGDSLSKLEGLNYLGLGKNNIQGNIPSSIGKLVNLKVIELSNNSLGGDVPQEISKCVNLTQLLLHGNKDLKADNINLDDFKDLMKAHLPGKELEVRGALGNDMKVVSDVWKAMGKDDKELTGTQKGDATKWKGIYVSTASGRITRVEWNDMELRSEQFPDDLFKLSMLEILNLSNNSIGGKITADAKPLEKLKEIKLGNNLLEGNIPGWICNCPKLEDLHLENNALTGSIPTQINNLGELKMLYLQQNKLTGKIPPQLGECAKLREIRLGENSLKGDIPATLSKCTLLSRLYVNENPNMGKTQDVPKDFSNMKSLTQLHLNDGLKIMGMLDKDRKAVQACWIAMGGNLDRLKNGSGDNIFNWWYVTVDESLGRVTELRWERAGLQGHIPEEIGNLGQLKWIGLGQNSLTGSIPEGIGKLKNLTELRLFENSLAGEIPKEIGGCKNLEVLMMGNNGEAKQGLSGAIPDKLCDCEELRLLSLKNNNLSGEIPESLGNCTQLEEIHLNGNDIAGSIPAWLGNCKKLIKLNLQENNSAFSTMVPDEVERLTKLTRIYLNDGLRIRGKLFEDAEAVFELWEALGGDEETLRKGEEGDVYKWEKVYIEDGRVTKLDWSEQNFKESIPPMIQKLDKLKVLKLSNNKIKESIPKEIGMLKELTELRLDNNNLSGEIPPALGGALDGNHSYPGCKKLEELYLNNNDLSKGIPNTLGECTKLRVLNLCNNTLTGKIPPRIGKCKDLEELLLNKNQLENEIPSDLGYLHKLKLLYLQNNNLTSQIPNLGQCKNLEELYLNDNQLDGKIPESLGECRELIKIYVHKNINLGKKVPSQVDALPNLKNLQVDSYGESSTGLLRGDLITLSSMWTQMEMDLKILQNGSEFNVKGWFGVTVDDKIGRVTKLDWSGKEPGEKGEGVKKGKEVEKDGDVLEGEENDENSSADAAAESESQGRGDKLFGRIPVIIGDLDALQCLNLSQNSLNGTIPKQLEKLQDLTTLHLEDNQLSGSIPPNLGFCVSLNELHLEKNKLSGDVPPELGGVEGVDGQKGCQRLAKLYVQENKSGLDKLPEKVKSIKWLNLVHLNEEDDVEIVGDLGKDAKAVLDCWKDLGGNEDDLKNEAGNDIFNWSEVTVESGRVTKLNWHQKGLTGFISEDIGNIKMLRELDLSRNSLSGKIPKEIGQLKQLVKLDLNHNFLEEFPSSIGDCEMLQELNLQKNQLDQKIPKDSIGKLRNLRHLYFTNNLLKGEIPDDIGKCTNLEDLRFDSNFLEGDILNTLVALKNCNKLFRIKFNGTDQKLVDKNIPNPDKIEGLDALTWLNLPKRGVQPQGKLGQDAKTVLSIWKKLGGNEETLKNGADDDVDLWANVVVQDIGDDGFRVTKLDWNRQNLHGKIPPEIGDLDSLKVLNLGHNEKESSNKNSSVKEQLNGAIPEELGNLLKLEVLRLDGNQFTGGIPKIFENCKVLRELYLNDNKLEGNFPAELGNLPLKKLHVQNNNLDGLIPSELDVSKELDLNSLLYNENKDLRAPNRQKPIDADKTALKLCWKILGGDPKELINGEKHDHSRWKGVTVEGYRVTEIDWSNCELSGTIPPQLKNLPALTSLKLSKNCLRGEIAKEIGLLGKLKKLCINDNKLSGKIPQELNKCKVLTHLDLSKNELYEDIPTLDQTALQVLNLQFNELSGAIPTTLGNVSDLSELKLNNNMFSEEFPEELGKLNKLKLLYVHFNGIHGRIPSELDKKPVELFNLTLDMATTFPTTAIIKVFIASARRKWESKLS